MCVRIAEPDLKIRLNVFKCLDVLLKITAVYKGTFTESYINEAEFMDKILYSNNPESCRKLLEVLYKYSIINTFFNCKFFRPYKKY